MLSLLLRGESIKGREDHLQSLLVEHPLLRFESIVQYLQYSKLHRRA